MNHSKLFDVLSGLIDLDERDKELVETFFKYGTVEKGKSLIVPGKPVEQVYFILSGWLKRIKTLASGEELVVFLFAPGDFATSLIGFFTGAPAEESLQTITEVEYLSATRDDLERLYASAPKWQVFGRRLMESFMLEKEQYIIDGLSLSAQERYAKLLAASPDIVANVPVKDIASSIGIQPESLSRIRKTIS